MTTKTSRLHYDRLHIDFWLKKEKGVWFVYWKDPVKGSREAMSTEISMFNEIYYLNDMSDTGLDPKWFKIKFGRKRTRPRKKEC